MYSKKIRKYCKNKLLLKNFRSWGAVEAAKNAAATRKAQI
jgi:hypothetical protein